MKKTIVLLSLVLWTLLQACGQRDSAIDLHVYEQDILDWRAGRLERLLAPTGYLNQVGLYWLEPGTYRFGSSAENEVVFPPNAPEFIGEFAVTDQGVHMKVVSDVDVLHEDRSVKDIAMAADTTEAPVMVGHGSLAWSVIERDSRFAIRLRDYEHPFVTTFGPIPYYDIDPAMHVEATLRRYPEPRVVNVGTVIEGLGFNPESPGVLEFQIDGNAYELEAYSSGDKLFIVFGDQTGRGETYGAGRFLYADAPGEDGRTRLDFNKAYNPPCAFNDFSTCPVASPRNRLATRIEAGEKYDKSLHFAAANR